MEIPSLRASDGSPRPELAASTAPLKQVQAPMPPRGDRCLTGNRGDVGRKLGFGNEPFSLPRRDGPRMEGSAD